MAKNAFSEAELVALRLAREGILRSHIPDKSYKDPIGSITPGLTVYKKLEKRGLLYETEEEPIDVNGEPFHFTPVIHLTEYGEDVAKTLWI